MDLDMLDVFTRDQSLLSNKRDLKSKKKKQKFLKQLFSFAELIQ